MSWLVSCCGDGDVDKVSEGDGGDQEERRKMVPLVDKLASFMLQ